MPGVLNMLLSVGGGRFNGALTVGNDGGGNYGYVVSVYGTLSPTTFLDSGGTTRTITHWNYNLDASGTVGFRLNGTSISNSNTTFYSINLNGKVLLRSAASYTADDGSGHTLWNWTTNTTSYPSSGTVTAVVN